VIQRGKEFCFALEAGDPIRVRCKSLRQNLERDVALEAGVLRAVDLPHAPLTK
jgi:hypothetical protein